MRRSSGTYAMPACASANGVLLVMFLSWKRMLPLRAWTSPMIVLSVVERPLPLRPSSATTSPRSTSRLTSCSTWLLS